MLLSLALVASVAVAGESPRDAASDKPGKAGAAEKGGPGKARDDSRAEDASRKHADKEERGAARAAAKADASGGPPGHAKERGGARAAAPSDDATYGRGDARPAKEDAGVKQPGRVQHAPAGEPATSSDPDRDDSAPKAKPGKANGRASRPVAPTERGPTSAESSLSGSDRHAEAERGNGFARGHAKMRDGPASDTDAVGKGKHDAHPGKAAKADRLGRGIQYSPGDRDRDDGGDHDRHDRDRGSKGAKKADHPSALQALKPKFHAYRSNDPEASAKGLASLRDGDAPAGRWSEGKEPKTRGAVAAPAEPAGRADGNHEPDDERLASAPALQARPAAAVAGSATVSPRALPAPPPRVTAEATSPAPAPAPSPVRRAAAVVDPVLPSGPLPEPAPTPGRSAPGGRGVRRVAWWGRFVAFVALGFRHVTAANADANDVRARVLARLREAPGRGVRALARDLDVAAQTVHYHVRQLERIGLVVRRSAAGTVRYYCRDGGRAAAQAAEANAALGSGPARDVLAFIAAHPGSAQSAVARALGQARGSVSWHARRLQANGFVAVSDQGLVVTDAGERAAVAGAPAASG